MFKNNKGHMESSMESMEKFLDISNVSGNPLMEIKDSRHLEKKFGISSGADLKNKGIIESNKEIMKRNFFEKFVLLDFGVEGFINEYFGF